MKYWLIMTTSRVRAVTLLTCCVVGLMAAQDRSQAAAFSVQVPPGFLPRSWNHDAHHTTAVRPESHGLHASTGSLHEGARF